MWPSLLDIFCIGSRRRRQIRLLLYYARITKFPASVRSRVRRSLNQMAYEPGAFVRGVATFFNVLMAVQVNFCRDDQYHYVSFPSQPNLSTLLDAAMKLFDIDHQNLAIFHRMDEGMTPVESDEGMIHVESDEGMIHVGSDEKLKECFDKNRARVIQFSVDGVPSSCAAPRASHPLPVDSDWMHIMHSSTPYPPRGAFIEEILGSTPLSEPQELQGNVPPAPTDRGKTRADMRTTVQDEDEYESPRASSASTGPISGHDWPPVANLGPGSHTSIRRSFTPPRMTTPAQAQSTPAFLPDEALLGSGIRHTKPRPGSATREDYPSPPAVDSRSSFVHNVSVVAAAIVSNPEAKESLHNLLSNVMDWSPERESLSRAAQGRQKNAATEASRTGNANSQRANEREHTFTPSPGPGLAPVGVPPCTCHCLLHPVLPARQVVDFCSFLRSAPPPMGFYGMGGHDTLEAEIRSRLNLWCHNRRIAVDVPLSPTWESGAADLEEWAESRTKYLHGELKLLSKYCNAKRDEFNKSKEFYNDLRAKRKEQVSMQTTGTARNHRSGHPRPVSPVHGGRDRSRDGLRINTQGPNNRDTRHRTVSLTPDRSGLDNAPSVVLPVRSAVPAATISPVPPTPHVPHRRGRGAWPDNHSARPFPGVERIQNQRKRESRKERVDHVMNKLSQVSLSFHCA